MLDAAMLSSGPSAEVGEGSAGAAVAGGRTLAAHRGFLARAGSIPVHQLYQEARARGKRLVLCGKAGWLAGWPGVQGRRGACGSHSPGIRATSIGLVLCGVAGWSAGWLAGGAGLRAAATAKGWVPPQEHVDPLARIGAAHEKQQRASQRQANQDTRVPACAVLQATRWAARSPLFVRSACCSTCRQTCTTPSGAHPPCLLDCSPDAWNDLPSKTGCMCCCMRMCVSR